MSGKEKSENLLLKFEQLGIVVDWATVLSGWKGIDLRRPMISIEQVLEYAEECISKNPADVSEELMSLAILTPEEVDDVKFALQKLVNKTNASLVFARRKWRLLLLLETLKYIKEQDPLHGLIRLTEFWEEFDYPSEMPHIVQGRGNYIDPASYYSVENFERILRAHDQWITHEISLLHESR